MAHVEARAAGLGDRRLTASGGPFSVPRGFADRPSGHPRKVVDGNGDESVTRSRPLPALVFLSRRSSGPSRRMESLVAWVKVTQKKRLRVIDLDVDDNPSLARRLAVGTVPALVLIKDQHVLGRLEGRATGQQIDELIRQHLAA